MFPIEHFLFFPVVVLISLILIVLTIKVLLRLFVLFLIIFGIWYGLYVIGFVPSPMQAYEEYRHHPQTKSAYARF